MVDERTMQDEHKAWRNFCAHFEKATGFKVNEECFGPMIKAVRYWGEELVLLRQGQDDDVRRVARENACDEVELLVDPEPPEAKTAAEVLGVVRGLLKVIEENGMDDGTEWDDPPEVEEAKALLARLGG